MALKALCIGINDYPGTQSDLHGCVNDAQRLGARAARRGFEVEHAARRGRDRRRDSNKNRTPCRDRRARRHHLRAVFRTWLVRAG